MLFTCFLEHYLYYWFGVGEGTLEIHHLSSNFAPAKPKILQTLPPPSQPNEKIRTLLYLARPRKTFAIAMALLTLAPTLQGGG
jgi:hypothetical protein